MHQPVHWTPRANPALVILAKPPDGGEASEPISLDLRDDRESIEGRYAHHRNGAGDIAVLILAGAPLDQASAALIPFSSDSPDRVEAVMRFWRAAGGLNAADTRLTPLQRHRIPRSLRAVDARSHGATYREIARTLRGQRRLSREQDWRSSPLRTEAIDLVRSALALIANGYLDLLRHRRRP